MKLEKIYMYKKLNLPSLDIQGNWHTNNIERKAKIGGYISYWVTDDFSKHIHSLFPQNFFPSSTFMIAQTIDSHFNGFIHKDIRKYAINYMVDKGGVDTYTALYNEDDTLADTYIQQPGEWYFLDTYKKHAVHGITSKRIALSICFFDFGDKQWDFINEI